MVNKETCKVSAGARVNAQADYCRKLCKLLTRYATPDEIGALTVSLEKIKDTIIKQRNAQGLHDAAYHLYGRFHLADSAILKSEVQS